MTIDSPFLNIKELAAYLRMSEPVTYGLVRAKDFPAFKIGGSWKVPKDKLDKWVLKQLDNTK